MPVLYTFALHISSHLFNHPSQVQLQTPIRVAPFGKCGVKSQIDFSENIKNKSKIYSTAGCINKAEQ